jgi:hypothetical protein
LLVVREDDAASLTHGERDYYILSTAPAHHHARTYMMLLTSYSQLALFFVLLAAWFYLNLSFGYEISLTSDS